MGKIMPNRYMGKMKDFMSFTTLYGKVTLHPSTTRNLNAIIKQLMQIFDIEELQNFRRALADHSIDIYNPHDTYLNDLSNKILQSIYEKWIAYGNHDSFESFRTIFFNEIHLADSDDILLSEDETLALTVEKFIRLLYLFHTGPLYAHKPILDKIVSGVPVTKPILRSIDRNINPTLDIEEKLNYGCGTFVIDIDTDTIYTDTYYLNVTHDVTYTYEEYAVPYSTAMVYMIEDILPTLSEGDTSCILVDYQNLLRPTNITEDEDNIISLTNVISMSRKRSTPLNLTIEVFDGIDIDQINIPISPNNHKFSISLNPNSITVGRRNTQGEGVVYSIPRSTNPHNFLNDTKSTKIENVKQFTHYGTSCSDEELIYLLT
jgi:hypothetical protein